MLSLWFAPWWAMGHSMNGRIDGSMGFPRITHHSSAITQYPVQCLASHLCLSHLSCGWPWPWPWRSWGPWPRIWLAGWLASVGVGVGVGVGDGDGLNNNEWGSFQYWLWLCISRPCPAKAKKIPPELLFLSHIHLALSNTNTNTNTNKEREIERESAPRSKDTKETYHITSHHLPSPNQPTSLRSSYECCTREV